MSGIKGMEFRAIRRFAVRVSTAFLVVLLLVLSLNLWQPQIAFAKICGNGQSGHCYGEWWWSVYPHYNGSYTDITIVPMGCSSPCLFITDEMWLTEEDGLQPNGNCSNGNTPATSPCWMEAGYYQQVNQGEDFFWAHQEPGGLFLEHDQGQVPSGAYGYNASIEIWHTGVALWGQSITAPGFNEGSTGIGQAYSPNLIMIGQELAGDSTHASAETATFTDNKYETNTNPSWY
jgi:hypothetical protein